MNCVDFVKSVLTTSDFEHVNKVVNDQAYIRNKQIIKSNSLIIFTVGLHIGIAKLWGCELETIEYSDGVEIRRHLSLYDDNIKIVMINPTGKKVGELKWLGV